MPKLEKLPKRVWVIFQKFFDSWEIKGTATTVADRDRLYRYYDNIPGSGRTLWKEYLDTGSSGPGLEPV